LAFSHIHDSKDQILALAFRLKSLKPFMWAPLRSEASRGFRREGGRKRALFLATRPGAMYRGTSLIRKRTPLGPYSRPMPRVLGGSYGGEHFLMSEVPLYATPPRPGSAEQVCFERIWRHVCNSAEARSIKHHARALEGVNPFKSVSGHALHF